MLAHFGSAWAFSSDIQWRSALSRHSSMNCGSRFLAAISRTVSSFRPLGTLSDSTSETKPHLYSRSARSRIVFTLVLMSSPGLLRPDRPGEPIRANSTLLCLYGLLFRCLARFGCFNHLQAHWELPQDVCAFRNRISKPRFEAA